MFSQQHTNSTNNPRFRSSERALQKLKANAVDSFLETAAFAQDVPQGVRAASLNVQHDAVARGWQVTNAKQAYVSDEVEQETKLQMTNFRQALQKFQSEAKSKYKPDMDLMGTQHSLEDVIQLISDASLKQQERKDFWGRVLRGFRAIGNKSSIYGQWLELLPTQNNYLSVLCGGLKMVIGAMKRMKKVREEISQAFETLPTMLLCNAKVDQIFMNFELHICSRKMLGKTFDILRCIVLELNRSAARTLVTAVLQQDLYAEELKESLEKMRQLHDEYKEVATTCSYQAIRSIETSVNILPEYLSQEHENTRSFVQQQMQTLRSTLQNLLEGCYADNIAFQQNLRDQVLTHKTAGPISDANRLHEDVVQMLDFDIDQCLTEPSDVQTRLWRGSSEGQDRLLAITQEPRFVSWFTDPNPSCIFINENRKDHGNPSAASHLCAKIAETMRAAEQPYAPICLYYFCDPHGHNGLSGPDNLLRALIGQLVSMFDHFDLQKIHKRLRKGYRDDCQQLWRMFDSLIQQLPPRTTLFCIVDNVTMFEIAEWRDEAVFVVEQMINLSAAMPPDRILKVLLTSPETSRQLYHSFRDDAVIDIPFVVPRAGDVSDRWLTLVE